MEYSIGKNTSLYNSLSATHPLLTVIVLAFFYLQILFFFKKTIFVVLTISISALLLGSEWSQQEVFWEGFWNWDYIEMIMLFIFIFFFIITHTKLNSSVAIKILLVNTLLIKLGTSTTFMKSIHSFSGNPLFFLDSLYMRVVLSISFVYILFLSQIKLTSITVTAIFIFCNYSIANWYQKDTALSLCYFICYLTILLLMFRPAQSINSIITILKVYSIFTAHHLVFVGILTKYLLFFTYSNFEFKHISNSLLGSKVYLNIIDKGFFFYDNLLKTKIHIFFQNTSGCLFTELKTTLNHSWIQIR